MTQDIVMNGASEQEARVAGNLDAVGELDGYVTSARGTDQEAELARIIVQVLEAPNIYVFGELLALPNMQALKESATHTKYYNTLNLFAYGTYKQYAQNPTEHIELNAAMRKKLQHLTLVSLAIETKCIPYDRLLEELDVSSVRNLEDIIIEAIYADMIHGKLIQNQRILEIDYAQGRDVPPGYISKISETLQNWVSACNGISSSIAEQIQFANTEKAKAIKAKEVTEAKFTDMKSAAKTVRIDDDPFLQNEHPSLKLPRRMTGATKKQNKPF